MGIRAAIYSVISTSDALTGASADPRLGTAEDPRYYPHAAPARTAFPYIVGKRDDQPEDRTLDRTGPLRSATFNFEVWGDDTDEVEAVAERLRSRLLASRGEYDDVSIRSAAILGESDDAVRPEDGSEVTWFVTVLNARFMYLDKGA